MNTLIGTNLGGYIIKRMLGSGGMGSVYLAEDPTIGQQVAIKVIRTEDTDFPDEAALQKATERFRQEARAVASLDHLHILPLFRYGEENSALGQRAYMIMQYRPEGSLWDWMRQRAGMVTGASLNIAPHIPAGLGTSWPMGVEEVSMYVLQAASALQYAHEHGLIHRDIKPANFLLRVDTTSPHSGPTMVAAPTGSVGYSVSLLLSDFGLAKFFSANSMSSRVFGTPTYMAPEQFEGEARPESDQYSLAVMVYYMLAARPPFEGDPMRLMRLHSMVEAPPIRQFIPSIPIGVEQTLARALAKQPQQRFPSIIAFADAFLQNSQQTPAEKVDPNAQTVFEPRPFPHTQGQKAVGNGPFPAPLGNIPLTPAPAPMAAPPPIQRPTTSPNPYYQLPATVTPPHTLPASERWTPASPASPAAPTSPVFPNSPHMLQGQATPAAVPGIQPMPPQPVPGMAQPVQLQPSLAYVNRRKALWIIGGTAATAIVAGTGAFLLLHNRTQGQVNATLTGHTDAISALSWSPDGTQLASASRDMTARLWSASNHQSTVTYRGHHAPVSALAWNPAGQLLASGGRDKEVQVWNAAGTTLHTYSSQGTLITALSWFDNSHILVGTFGKGVHLLTLTNTQPIPKTGTTLVRAIALSPNKRFEAIGFEDGFLSVINLNTRKPQASYVRHKGALNAVAWSLDGTMLASAGNDGLVHVFDAVSGRLVHSLQHAGAVNGVAWDPASNSRLASACADKQLYIWNVDNSSSTTYTGHTEAVTALSWHSKGGLASGSQDKTILLWSI